jgi:lysophospholipase L1-like esterase
VSSLLVCWGIPEVVVRIINPRLDSFHAVIFGGDPNSPVLFMKDAYLGWKLRPDTTTQFFGDLVHVDPQGFRSLPGKRQEGSNTVLCLGDSTTFGWGVPAADIFPTRLESLLNRSSEKVWRVVNAGVPAYSSHQLRLRAAQLLPLLRPKVVVIITGNNDVVSVKEADEERFRPRPIATAVTALLSHSRFLVWAAETVRPERPLPVVEASPAETVPRVSGANFAENLTHLAHQSRAHGAAVIFLEPTVNFMWPPIGPDSPLALALHRDYQLIQELLEKDQQDAALQLAVRLAADRPGNLAYQWLKGYTLGSLKRVEEGTQLLDDVFENDPFPGRCKRSYRHILALVARDEKCPLLDPNELFAQRTWPAYPTAHFIDWCHPSAEGHEVIAEALFQQIVKHPSGSRSGL